MSCTWHADRLPRECTMEISRDDAIAACGAVRRAHAHRLWSPAHWQCWGCMRFGGEPEKRCMRSETGWAACPQLNRWLERAGRAEAS